VVIEFTRTVCESQFSLIRGCLHHIYLFICKVVYLFLFQYELLHEKSEEKLEVLRTISETVMHRNHLDHSVDFIGKLLFGVENGPSTLQSVRPAGQPLVDDWDCLKRLVSKNIRIGDDI
jgi:hypothetical protein